MKTIEERAQSIAGWILRRDGMLKSARLPHFIEEELKRQRAIDIDKACAWWNKELREVNYGTYNEAINAFRKAMLNE